jgi:molecular chaperone GrpE (heat shock protein)
MCEVIMFLFRKKPDPQLKLITAGITKLLQHLTPLREIPSTVVALIERLDLQSKQSLELSLQIEEIYDIIKDGEQSADELRTLRSHELTLVEVVAQMTDMLDDLTAFTATIPQLEEQSAAIANKTDLLLQTAGMLRLAKPGDALNPKLHTVVQTADAGQEPETITQVLRSGYSYKGKVVKKSQVIVNM